MTDPDRLDEFIAADRDRSLSAMGLPPDPVPRSQRVSPPDQAPIEQMLGILHDLTGDPAKACQWPGDAREWPACVIIRIDSDGPDRNRAAVKADASTERILLVNTDAANISKWYRFLADAGYTFESASVSDQ